jgi:hypothetical protein
MYVYSTPRKWNYANKYNIDYCFNCKYSKSGTPFYTNTVEGIDANSPSEALQILKTQLGDVENTGGGYDSSSDIVIGLSLDVKYYNLLSQEFVGYANLTYDNNLKSKQSLISYDGLGEYISSIEEEIEIGYYYPDFKKVVVTYERGMVLYLEDFDEINHTGTLRVYELKDGYSRYSGDSDNNLPTQEDKRIPTTCCLLVCCEPTKYKLV